MTLAFKVPGESGAAIYVSEDDPLPVSAVASGGALGALTDDAETDPDAVSASIASILRGILTELQAQTVILNTIATNTTPP
jgi:hypothetical protein